MKQYIVTGTDTEIGKTVCSAMLTLALGAQYWKPLQSGIADGADKETVQQLTQLPDEHFLDELYVLNEPLSPHRSAEIDGVEIDIGKLVIPAVNNLIIEGAGGLMVPLNRQTLYIDIFKQWNIPVILCARTALGTINHTLLSVEALKARNIPIHGLVFIGEENADNMRTIVEFSGEKLLGHIPALEELNAQNLQNVFDRNFKKEDF